MPSHCTGSPQPASAGAGRAESAPRRMSSDRLTTLPPVTRPGIAAHTPQETRCLCARAWGSLARVEEQVPLGPVRRQSVCRRAAGRRPPPRPPTVLIRNRGTDRTNHLEKIPPMSTILSIVPRAVGTKREHFHLRVEGVLRSAEGYLARADPCRNRPGCSRGRRRSRMRSIICGGT
jgi:hypothetical protein